MLRRSFFVLMSVIIVACNKDKLETAPSIKVKRLNTEVAPNETLNIFLEFSDKEGDLSNGMILYVRQRINVKPIPNSGANDQPDTVRTALPEFPDKSRGEIQITIPYNFLNEDPTTNITGNDTAIFRIMVADSKGNKSDTISTDPVVALFE